MNQITPNLLFFKVLYRMTDLESVVESNLLRYSRALGQMFFASLTVYTNGQN